MSVPDFFLVGHPKCGTTALYQMLGTHPQVYFPALKEPMFFAPDLPMRFRLPTTGSLPETASEYAALYALREPWQLAGDASAFYLFSRVAASRIVDANPEARIVAVIREPAALLRSVHLQLLQDRLESVRDLRTALQLEEPRRSGRRVPSTCYRPEVLRYSEYPRFAAQLNRYFEAFGRDRVLVLVYDDLRADNLACLNKICRHLGLDPSHDFEPLDANPTVSIRSRTIEDLVHRVSVGHGRTGIAIKRAIKTVTPQRVRRSALAAAQRSLQAPPPEEDPQLAAEIRAEFLPEIQAVSELLGRDLVSLWGNQRAA